MSKSILSVFLVFFILWIHCGGNKNPIVPDEAKDPEKNFEVLWQIFEDSYAFFELRNVDWHAQYQTFRPQVKPNTTDDELFNIMTEMLRPLEDRHVELCRSSRVCFSPGIPHPVLNNEDRRIEAIQVVTGTYLNGNFSSEGNEKFIYGKLTESIGYLNILSMQGFTTTNRFVEQPDAARNAMDKIIREFKDLDALIIDIRFNRGGADINSLIIASRLADQKRLAFSQQARNGGYEDFTPLREVFVEPDGPLQFTKKIVLLTSGLTFSAAEVFTMSLMPIPYVTRVGENTGGGFSTISSGRLPNGWTFGLSNERYFSHEGINYEKIGISPDIEIFMTDADIDANKDSILDAALQVLQGN